ncbi:hypothetical protein [Mycobacterium sp. 3519A]|uniref:hypothetical protein n=1 Tax=Mycobacterium sp. 3519A TaxID=2057184 RepID=UPI00115AC862|nr:hypothetical protein [Mycobacterium sp. 3519A]
MNTTLQNIGLLTNQTFQNGVAPLLSQVLKNQENLIQGLGEALQQSLQISNPSSVPAQLQLALSQIAAGHFEQAANTIATGATKVTAPFAAPLAVPLVNVTKVVDLLPTVVFAGASAVASPPLALIASTGAAIQAVADAGGTGNIAQVVAAVIDAPATMINGFLNGAGVGLPGLLSPGGTLSTLVKIRDAIVAAITPTAAATTSSPTGHVAAIKTKAAQVVTLDVPRPATDKATRSSTASTEKADTDRNAANARGRAAHRGATLAAPTTNGAPTARRTGDGHTGTETAATDGASGAKGMDSTTLPAKTAKTDSGSKTTSATKKKATTAKSSPKDAKSSHKK